MAIVKFKNQSGVTYAYESIAVWDPEKKQSRPKRVYLGRVDEKTGEIISTAGKRGRPSAKKAASGDARCDGRDYASLYAESARRIESLTAQLAEEKRRSAAMASENRRLVGAVRDLAAAAQSVLDRHEGR